MPENQDARASNLKRRRLLHGEIEYNDAKESDRNILHELSYWEQERQYINYLYQRRELIKEIVVHHLGLNSTDTCHLADQEHWMHGSFNICIRVDINRRNHSPSEQVIIRFPLPYRVGESSCPGNANEKILCEAGTYAWLQENCPDVPIPQLHGFGLSTGQTFTILDKLPLITRCVQRLRRLVLRLWGYESPSQYVCRRGQVSLGTGYILTEYIDPSRGKLLSETWTDGRHNAGMRTNLFHGLSRIILSLARTPLPKIGSFVIDEKGYLRLSNRPLTLQIQQLENEQIPVDIPRGITYSTVDSYVNDILAIHESRLRHQPNAIHDLRDGLYQTSALTLMRSVWSCYFRRDFLRGPFFLSLTDLHPRNIFVDDDWNIKCLIDLEWACTRPVEMIHPPFWLSNQAIDLISLDDYENLHNEFMEAFEKEEARITPGSGPSFRLYPVLQQGWKRGTFWCSLALNSPTALFKIFFDHIQPRFSKTNLDDASFWTITMSYWTFDTLEFIKEKMEDNENYDRSLREAFES